MSQLNNKHILTNARSKCLFKQDTEELEVLSKISDTRELGLEVFPNLMGLETTGLFCQQQNLFLQVLIVLFR